MEEIIINIMNALNVIIPVIIKWYLIGCIPAFFMNLWYDFDIKCEAITVKEVCISLAVAVGSWLFFIIQALIYICETDRKFFNFKIITRK